MANLIDYNFFVYPCNVPNTDKPEVRELLGSMVKDIEPTLLTELLGEVLYAVLLDALAFDPLEERFTLLVEGGQYTYEGKTYVWKGLANPTTLYSVIALYVFYFYISKVESVLTGTGVQTAQPENALQVRPMESMVEAWNKYTREAIGLITFLRRNKGLYPEQHYVEYPRYKNSLDL